MNESPRQELGRSQASLKVGVLVIFGAAFLALAALLFLLLKHRNPQDSVPPSESRQRQIETPLETKDFSTSNSVCVRLGQDESGGGIVHISTERDGLTAVGSVEGVACRYMDFEPESKTRTVGYFYFAVDPSFKQADFQNVTIDVEYRSAGQVTIGLDYDSATTAKSKHSSYMHAPSVGVRPSSSWQTTSFSLEDAGFQNSQNGHADFRLWVRPPSLFLRKVTVTRESRQ
jgi:hypothetical protein